MSGIIGNYNLNKSSNKDLESGSQSNSLAKPESTLAEKPVQLAKIDSKKDLQEYSYIPSAKKVLGVSLVLTAAAGSYYLYTQHPDQVKDLKSEFSTLTNEISNQVSAASENLTSLANLASTKLNATGSLVQSAVTSFLAYSSQTYNSFVESVVSPTVVSPTVVKQPVANQPVVSPTVVKQPVANQPVVSPTVVKQPVANQLVVSPTVVKQAVANQPLVSPTVVKQPVANQLVVSPTVVKQAVANQPVVSPTVVKQPVANQPLVSPTVVKQPVANQLVVSPTVVKQAVANQPVVSPTVVKQPVANQPVVSPTVVKQPEANQPEANQPVVSPTVLEQSATVKAKVIDQNGIETSTDLSGKITNKIIKNSSEANLKPSLVGQVMTNLFDLNKFFAIQISSIIGSTPSYLTYLKKGAGSKAGELMNATSDAKKQALASIEYTGSAISSVATEATEVAAPYLTYIKEGIVSNGEKFLNGASGAMRQGSVGVRYLASSAWSLGESFVNTVSEIYNKAVLPKNVNVVVLDPLSGETEIRQMSSL